MTIVFDMNAGNRQDLLRQLTAGFRGRSAALDAEIDRDLAAALRIDNAMQRIDALVAGQPETQEQPQ